jgi:hypothetical protein
MNNVLTILYIIYVFLCIVDNWNEMYVIVMYKFSGCHAKKFVVFLLQMAGFLEKSVDYLLNPIEIRWPNFG